MCSMAGPDSNESSWGAEVGPVTQEGIRLRVGIGVLRALRRVVYLHDMSEKQQAPPNKGLFVSRDHCHNPSPGLGQECVPNKC